MTFDPGGYIDICRGKYVGGLPKEVSCSDVPFADGQGTATEIEVVHMTCGSARTLIAKSPASQYVKHGGRFLQSGFRCGSEGAADSLDDLALFECDLDRREFLYSVRPAALRLRGTADGPMRWFWDGPRARRRRHRSRCSFLTENAPPARHPTAGQADAERR